jgi:hypothetical protein
MSGGKRTRKQRSKRTRKQRGGRYGFFPEGDVNPHGQAWWAGSYAPIQRIGCEGGSFNPLNPTHTGSSAPPGAANPNYWMKGGSQATTGQRGGAQQMAPATYGVGNVDSMYYYAPTAGYANTASTWKDSVGAPVQIQVPFAAREMNQACLSTGGHPPLTGALQKGGKRTRKQRGGNLLDNARGFFSEQAARLPSYLSLGKLRRNLGLGGPAAAEAVANAEGAQNAINNGEGNGPVNGPLQPVVNVPAMPAVNAIAQDPFPGPNAANTNVGEASSEGGSIVVGGRKRRHRKHKKTTHKRRH